MNFINFHRVKALENLYAELIDYENDLEELDLKSLKPYVIHLNAAHIPFILDVLSQIIAERRNVEYKAQEALAKQKALLKEMNERYEAELRSVKKVPPDEWAKSLSSACQEILKDQEKES